jgi:hypothetical protein
LELETISGKTQNTFYDTSDLMQRNNTQYFYSTLNKILQQWAAISAKFVNCNHDNLPAPQ